MVVSGDSHATQAQATYEEQLDRIIRKAAGNNAIKELISANAAVQKYLLSDGSVLSVRTATDRIEGASHCAATTDAARGHRDGVARLHARNSTKSARCNRGSEPPISRTKQ